MKESVSGATALLTMLGLLVNICFMGACAFSEKIQHMNDNQTHVFVFSTFIGITSLVAGSIALLNAEFTWVRIVGAFLVLQPVMASMCAIIVTSGKQIKAVIRDCQEE